MSVVVRMEMPQDCINCDLRYECNSFYAPGKPKPFMKGCRIVCQLPEWHGRLVDMRDIEQMEVSASDKQDKYFVGWNDAIKICQTATTIVPADTAERSET